MMNATITILIDTFMNPDMQSETLYKILIISKCYNFGKFPVLSKFDLHTLQ